MSVTVPSILCTILGLRPWTGVQDLGDCFDQYGPLSAFEDVHAYKNSMIISTYIYPAIIIIDIDSGKKG